MDTNTMGLPNYYTRKVTQIYKFLESDKYIPIGIRQSINEIITEFFSDNNELLNNNNELFNRFLNLHNEDINVQDRLDLRTLFVSHLDRLKLQRPRNFNYNDDTQGIPVVYEHIDIFDSDGKWIRKDIINFINVSIIGGYDHMIDYDSKTLYINVADDIAKSTIEHKLQTNYYTFSNICNIKVLVKKLPKFTEH